METGADLLLLQCQFREAGEVVASAGGDEVTEWKPGNVVYSAGEGYRQPIEIRRHVVVRASDKQIKLDGYTVWPLGKSQGSPSEFVPYLADTEAGAVQLLVERVERRVKSLEDQAQHRRQKLADILAAREATP